MTNVVQSTYGRYMSAGVVGAWATISQGNEADTKQAEGTIAFGLACSKGSADDGALLGGTNFIGISMRDITLVHTTPDAYLVGDNMAVATKGEIWVTAGGNVSAGQQVHYNTTTGVMSGSGGTAIAGAKFLDTVLSGAKVRVRLGTASEDLTS